jgi:Inorganic pyrophosphatase
LEGSDYESEGCRRSLQAKNSRCFVSSAAADRLQAKAPRRLLPRTPPSRDSGTRRSSTRRRQFVLLEEHKRPDDDVLAARRADAINVVVETPRGCRNKFKFDEKLGTFRMNSVLPAGSVFPFDFGYFPGTRAETVIRLMSFFSLMSRFLRAVSCRAFTISRNVRSRWPAGTAHCGETGPNSRQGRFACRKGS